MKDKKEINMEKIPFMINEFVFNYVEHKGMPHLTINVIVESGKIYSVFFSIEKDDIWFIHHKDRQKYDKIIFRVFKNFIQDYLPIQKKMSFNYNLDQLYSCRIGVSATRHHYLFAHNEEAELNLRLKRKKEKDIQKIKRVLEKYPDGITHSEITRATRLIDKDDRIKYLQELVDKFFCRCILDSTMGRQKKIYKIIEPVQNKHEN